MCVYNTYVPKLKHVCLVKYLCSQTKTCVLSIILMFPCVFSKILKLKHVCLV